MNTSSSRINLAETANNRIKKTVVSGTANQENSGVGDRFFERFLDGQAAI